MLRGVSVVKCAVQPRFSVTILKPTTVKTSAFRPITSHSIKTAPQKLYSSSQTIFSTRSLRFFEPQQLRHFSTNTGLDSQAETLSTEPKIEILGNQVPKPIPTFDDIPSFPTQLRENITSFGWKHLIKVQQYAIPSALANRDLLISSQTGTGKTAAFLIPMLMNILQETGGKKEIQSKLEYSVLPRGLVLVPTRELAQQVAREAEKLSHGTSINTCAVFGGVSIKMQLTQIYRSKPDIIIATPGRFIDLRTRGAIVTSRVNHVVLDEGDMMLDMGFMPAVQDILGDPQFNANRQLMFFSATFPKAIREIAEEFLRDPVKIFVGLNKPSALIKQKVVYVSGNSDKEAQLLEFLRTAQGRTLVFAETKKRTDALFHFLRFNGLKVACIHGDHIQSERDLAVEAFIRGDVSVLVATNVASRGLDIKGVSHVVNYDFPQSMEPYIHRIGRTGRAGVPGTALSFFSDADFDMAEDLKQVLKEANQEIPEFLSGGRTMRARNLATDVAPPPGYLNRPPAPPSAFPRAWTERPGYQRQPDYLSQRPGGKYSPNPRPYGQYEQQQYQPQYNQPQYNSRPGGYNQGYNQSQQQGYYQSRPQSNPQYSRHPPPSSYPSQAVPPGSASRNVAADKGNLDLMSLLNDNSKPDNKQ